jgi:polyhydroxyalkanoate synthesis regulator phasin
MAKHSNTVYFSLDKEARDKLESIAHENESIGLVAKRLILEMIGDGQSTPTLPPGLDDRLEKIEKHLEWCKRQAIEHDRRLKEVESKAYWTDMPDVAALGDRLSALEKQVAELSSQAAIVIQKRALPPMEPRIPTGTKRKPKNQEQTP